MEVLFGPALMWGPKVSKLANQKPFLSHDIDCVVASIVAHMILKSGRPRRKLDTWMKALRWDQVLARGWGAMFIVLSRQSNKTVASDFPIQSMRGLGLLARARLHEWQARWWYEKYCSRCSFTTFLSSVVFHHRRVIDDLWFSARQLPEIPVVQLDGTPRCAFPAELVGLFKPKQGLRCAVLGDQVKATCLPWYTTVEAPMEADFRAPFESGQFVQCGASVPTHPLPSVAVCGTGALRGVQLKDGLSSIRRHVVEALAANLFAYSPVKKATELKAAVEQLAGGLGHAKTILVAEEWSKAELAIIFDAARPGSPLSKFKGNWRSPLFNQPGGSLLMLYHQAMCHQMVVAHEQQRGSTYSLVVWTRLDMYWMVPHPPLQLGQAAKSLAGESIVWVPRGEDWFGGLNDRHAAFSRRAFDIHHSSFHKVASGNISGVQVGKFGTSSEHLWRSVVQRANVTLRRFDSAAFIMCCEASETCNHNSGKLWGITSRHAGVIKPVGPGCAKYLTEAMNLVTTMTDAGSYLALGLTYWARLPSWRWTATGGLREKISSSSSSSSSILTSASSSSAHASDVSDSGRLGDWSLVCCQNPSGGASCYAWMFRLRCDCLA
eukprot:TRINITY_DN733_c1_g1_i13.p1 TRINITY_DN733_c1_g1~~TRINITY_DN733_c1_g1_i13.p1  ORF type:complete len:652 (+),score=72.30 TRINITY_DN733_c1_g1_i13:141-1958(+)